MDSKRNFPRELPSLEQMCTDLAITRVLYPGILKGKLEEGGQVHEVISSLPMAVASRVFSVLCKRTSNLISYKVIRMFARRGDLIDITLKSPNGKCPLTKKELLQILSMCDELQFVTLNQARCVDDDVLEAITTACKRNGLERLEVAFCRHITRRGILKVLDTLYPSNYDGDTKSTTVKSIESKRKPSEVSRGISLRTINLSGCSKVVRGKEEDIRRLICAIPTTIRCLGFSGAKLSIRLQEKLFNRLTNLRDLDLSNARVFELSPNVSQLINLRSLNLQGNSLTSLPGDAFKGLLLLETLNISGNKLVKLPPEIGLLRSLKRLNLRANSLSYIPLGLGRLRKLRRLDVSFNGLLDLPEDLELCPSLENVICTHNKMKGIPLWLLRRRVSDRTRTQALKC
mmetsp:Transcript_18018/g.28695  ORF Transcript_18018/g.28695 Transcript_18018/m.28695 type:complete len:400 (-) Transcript_18018:77-1276(-)